MRRTATIALLLAIAFMVGCGPQGKKDTVGVQSVAYETAHLATVTRTIGLVGTVLGEKQAVAASKIMGKVTSIARPEGSWANEGDAIAWVVNDIPGMDYKPGPVTAPISGVVGKVYVDVGQTVAPGVPVAAVANYSSRVRVRASISDQDLRFVQKGALGSVTVSAFPDTVFAGKVSGVTPVLDQMSRTATVEFSLENGGRKLIPGMACGVQLVLEEKKDVVAVPVTALFTDGFSKIAILDGSTARFRSIEVGLVGDRTAEVVIGIEAGDKIITTGKERIEDGDEVRAVEAVTR